MPNLLTSPMEMMINFRQAGVSTEKPVEMFGHSIKMAMKYGRPKAKEKERAAEALEEMVTGYVFVSLLLYGLFRYSIG